MTQKGLEEEKLPPEANNKAAKFDSSSNNPDATYITEVDGEFVAVSYNNEMEQPLIEPLTVNDHFEPTEQKLDSLTQLSPLDNSSASVYITEIDGEFVTVSYNSDAEKPSIGPLKINNISRDNEHKLDFLISNPVPETEQKSTLLSGKRGLFVGIATGILLAFGGMRLLSPAQQTADIAKNISTSGVQPLNSTQSVTVAEVGTSEVNRSLAATGTVAAFEMIPVMSEATGLQITEVLTERGDYVKVGQLLARLDDSTLQAQLAQAKGAVAEAEAALAELRAGTRSEEIAQAKEKVKTAEAALVQAQSDLDLVKKRVERNKTLEAEGAIPRDRLDEILNQQRLSQANQEKAQAGLEEAKQHLAELVSGPRKEQIYQAEAKLAQAKANVQLVTAQLKDTQIVAAVSGKVAERNARIGDITSPSTTLFTIIENGRLELRLNVPQTQLNQIRPGQNVTIASDAEKNLNLSGKVREIDPIVNGESRQATVKVDIPTGTSLKPGMFLRASIVTGTGTGMTSPVNALLPQNDGGAIAYILQKDNTVKAQQVEMGEILPGEKVEIKSGLNKGDRIVVRGAAYLQDGDRVQVINR